MSELQINRARCQPKPATGATITYHCPDDTTPTRKDNTFIGHCARCGDKVTGRNFGAASHHHRLLCWCSDCTAANQQPQLELQEREG